MTTSQHSQHLINELIPFYLLVTEELFPGKVILSSTGSLLIKSFIPLPVNGSADPITQFPVPAISPGQLEEGDYVTFACNTPVSRRSVEQGKPFITDLQPVAETDALDLAKRIQQKLADEFRQKLTHRERELDERQKQYDLEKSALVHQIKELDEQRKQLGPEKDALVRDKKRLDEQQKQLDVEKDAFARQERNLDEQRRQWELEKNDYARRETELNGQWKQLELEQKAIAHQQKEVDEQRKQLELEKNALTSQEKELNEQRAQLELDQVDHADQKRQLASARSAIYLTSQRLEEREQKCEQKEATLRQTEARIRPFLDDSPTKVTSIMPSSDFSKLGERWLSILGSCGHITTSDGVSEQSFLLSLLCTLFTGGLLLLDGPVGVGKTSIVKRTAEVLTGVDDASDVVPVRPGWIDSTDLVGFYDPHHREFQPGTFLTALRKAGIRSDRLHLICLDELNLARIENYGADLLSCMEYRQERQLPLYSLDVQSSLRTEWQHLTSIEDQSQRRTRLTQLLDTFPAQFQLPMNAVIAGTLNSDETTYDISPKVIDRAFVVRLPAADLANVARTKEVDSDSQRCVVDVCDFRQAVGVKKDANIDFDWLMERVKEFQEPLKFLGIPLGYRAKRDLETFAAVARAIGLENREVILKHFLLTKILPRIRCQKNERTPKEWEKLQSLLRSIHMTDSTGVIENLERQWADRSRYTVRYFDVVQ